MLNKMLSPDMARMMKVYLDILPDKGRICDIGTGFGESALFFAESKPNYIVYSVDAFGMVGDGRVWKEFHADNILYAINNYKSANNIIQILGNSQTVKWELPVDAIYLDADHRYEGVKKDFEVYSPWLKDGGYIFFDDYLQAGNPTNGVKRLVDKICEDGWELLFADITATVRRK